MDLSQISALIGSYGFPIVACAWMALRYEKSNAILTTAVNNNTKIIAILCAKIGIDADEVGSDK